MEKASGETRSIWEEYRLLGELFRGPATVAWSAEHVISGRRTRLTTVHAPPMASGVTQEAVTHAFRRAAQQSRDFSHSDHLSVIGIAEQAGLPVAVTMLDDGALLSERLTERPVPLSDAMKRVSQIAHAVAALHGSGRRHGYLVPENLWVRADGRIALIDSGLHAAAAHAAFSSGFPLAPCLYASPTVDAYAEANQAADVHSLVALLLRLVTGRVIEPDALVEAVNDLSDLLPASLRTELRDAVLVPRSDAAPNARSLAVHLAFDTAWIRAQERTLQEQELVEGVVLSRQSARAEEEPAPRESNSTLPGGALPSWPRMQPAAGVLGGAAAEAARPDIGLPKVRLPLTRLADAGRALVDSLRQRVLGRSGHGARREAAQSNVTPLIAGYAVRLGPFKDLKTASMVRGRVRREWPMAAVVSESGQQFVQVSTCATRARAQEMVERLHAEGEPAEVCSLMG